MVKITIVCPENSTICSTMEGAGAGLGVFIQYMGEALPVLLIVLALVGIIVAVGYGIAHVVRKSITGTHYR